jgi:phosphoribosyl-dephospho-CoA transferase
MMPLHRHQLACLSEGGWLEIERRIWDPEAQACLAHWAARRLPLVVTQQSGDPALISLGLPAPARWSRRRLALSVPRLEVRYFDEFPSAEKATALLPSSTRQAWRRLCAGLKALGLPARIYGSYGWQILTGLDHLREGSDIDLWLSVSDPRQADAATVLLQSFTSSRLRLDGELMFDGGSAVAWREWPVWRSGRVRHLLVKSLNGSSLVEQPMAEPA